MRLAERWWHPRGDIAQEREIARVESRVLGRAERVRGRDTRERPGLQLIPDDRRVDILLGRGPEQRERVVRRCGGGRRRARPIGVGLDEYRTDRATAA